MFAPDLGSLVHGYNIDRPHNGLLLAMDLHKSFGALLVWFEATDVSQATLPTLLTEVTD